MNLEIQLRKIPLNASLL